MKAEEPYKVKMYAVDSKGRADYICEATCGEEIPSGMDNIENITLNDLIGDNQELEN